MMYYLAWWIGGWAFSVCMARRANQPTWAQGMLLLCLVYGPLPGIVYALIAANRRPPEIGRWPS